VTNDFEGAEEEKLLLCFSVLDKIKKITSMGTGKHLHMLLTFFQITEWYSAGHFFQYASNSPVIDSAFLALEQTGQVGLMFFDITSL
jgi:hypothetical protein